jgi:glycosyltransferase involved in cell wall biosynthesis
MRILVATDAWHPQVNGVVRTLSMMAEAAKTLGAEVVFLTPQSFRTVALPSYPDLRIALPGPTKIARLIEEAKADCVHIATEGPIGIAARRYCRKHGLRFTTSFHTRFPEYVSARFPIPESWVWAWLRRFHGASQAVMAATPALAEELRGRGFRNVVLWPRGVDTKLFHPRVVSTDLPRPIFLCVGRVAVEKNLEAFLSLELPGSKVVVGDGPARADLQRQFPDAVFLGAMQGEALAEAYAMADVFVFPSRTDTFGLVLLEALAGRRAERGFAHCLSTGAAAIATGLPGIRCAADLGSLGGQVPGQYRRRPTPRCSQSRRFAEIGTAARRRLIVLTRARLIATCACCPGR